MKNIFIQELNHRGHIEPLVRGHGGRRTFFNSVKLCALCGLFLILTLLVPFAVHADPSVRDSGLSITSLKEPARSADDTVPKAERQIVFGVSPFDGAKYVSSFLPEARKDMLLSADADNTITVLLSDVYYWPITAEYRADFQGVHIPLAGKLLVYKEKELYRTLEQVDYIYVYPQGPSGEATQVLSGDEMTRFIKEVEGSRDERIANPNRIWASFQGPFRGFIVNLPAGNYRLVFSVENEGKTFDMEKKLRVFSPLGTGTAYQIIPDEKWTVSSDSETSQQRIYLKPESIIYLKLFPTLLYSKADYERMTSPHRPSAGMGLENSSLWVHKEISLEESGQNSLSIEAAGQSGSVKARAFLVRQTEGSALGYTILDYDPAKFPDTPPTFTAYRLPAPPPGVGVTLKIPGMEKETLRYLRCLESRALYFPLLAFIFPAVVLLAAFITGTVEKRKMK